MRTQGHNRLITIIIINALGTWLNKGPRRHLKWINLLAGYFFFDSVHRVLERRAASTAEAAILPGAPITPPPGCAPAPHSSSRGTGVLGPGPQGLGRNENSRSRDMAPWKMFWHTRYQIIYAAIQEFITSIITFTNNLNV